MPRIDCNPPCDKCGTTLDSKTIMTRLCTQCLKETDEHYSQDKEEHYSDQEHIEEAKDGKFFGHRGEYRYRVLGKDKICAIHHTNIYLDAVFYLDKCRKQWIKDDNS